jgi:hypothetical protein
VLERGIERILGLLAAATERFLVWHHWPFLSAILIVIGHRANLRRKNLTDTETQPPKITPPDDADIMGARSYDGSFNDLGEPWMGMAGARFGRNIPISHTFSEKPPELYDPSPRLVSNRLLARQAFVPVPHLNILAAAWIQFMVHDWLSHGPNDKDNLHEIPLAADDDWRQRHGEMKVPYTRHDPDTNPLDDDKPATYRNTETHWWDGSQIYGSSRSRCEQVRSNPSTGQMLDDGKLWLDSNGALPLDAEMQDKHHDLELAGVNGNWWIGLSVLHTLFAREHNAIVDRLKVDHPDKSGEWLFQKARLVNAALLAKIHTVEWTPALMDSAKGRMLMRGNYWGLKGEHARRAFGRLSDSEVVSGIPGSPQDHHSAPFAMTEEFTAAYRLHSLLPDEFSFRSHRDDEPLSTRDLPAVSMGGARSVYEEVPYDDVVYSLATLNPGALVLHNFPNSLRDLNKKPSEGRSIDLAAVDILRDRERGVPRFKEFRRLTGMTPPGSFADITDDPVWQRELEEVYGSVDKVDLLIGTLAEAKSKRGTPERFGFSDTPFRIFIVMASRRLKSDRFFTDDFRPEVYTQAGFDWVTNNSLTTVMKRHCPALAGAFGDARNLFFPWTRTKR